VREVSEELPDRVQDSLDASPSSSVPGLNVDMLSTELVILGMLDVTLVLQISILTMLIDGSPDRVHARQSPLSMGIMTVRAGEVDLLTHRSSPKRE